MCRFDIADAYYTYYVRWNANGITNRCARQGRSIGWQLHRMHYKPGSVVEHGHLTPEATDAYIALVERHEGPMFAAIERDNLEEHA